METDELKPNGSIGFIGLGMIGGVMVRRLLRAGCKVNIYSRRRQGCEAFIDAGANWRDSKKRLAADSDKIFTIVGGPDDVEEVYLGENGLVAGARPGTVMVDMTTSSPELARAIFARALEKDVHVLDGPVTGGVQGAERGQLTIMAGGDEAALEKVRPELSILAGRIFPVGPAGAGQTTKICNQLAVAGIMLGMSEALHCAKNSGLAAEKILGVLLTGTASSTLLERIGGKMLRGDESAGFYVSHFIKDMTIAIENAEAEGRRLPMAELCRRMYREVAADNGGRKGIQSLVGFYDKAGDPGKGG